ncbi:NAD(P)-dependent oxidoreductase [Rhizobium sp. NXC24]|uniref:NAD-dependent epimerase/dehydratase family protein n=1 Tax=Rhizobium sp. NXC24 TaxID=2048897 RepID=UPI000CDF3D36|nr:NAD(P)-dependent oxidoreductase [Rhizobium sp. NXC24]AVA25727.1 NAD-dependent epimerase/dehydratase family protein [Rhizobium sp. NXC24]
MKIAVSGATGFVGRHVVARLLNDGHDIVAIARDASKATKMPWADPVTFLAFDLYREPEAMASRMERPDIFVHLAWPGLPDYRGLFNLTHNLGAEIALFRWLIEWGVPHLVVAGTCLEYGLQFGPLAEYAETRPTTPYGLAKDTLRKTLQLMQNTQSFTLQWMRLFYMYGPGQSERSLLSQLDKALAEKRPTFDMSPGDQLRDYLPIEEVAERFARVIAQTEISGIINCCSGRPISVLDLVERHLQANSGSIHLNRGVYSYPDYEALAFWGVPEKLKALGFR